MRAALYTLVACIALTGCGASSPTASDAGAAELVPANVSVFVSVDADLSSEQWDNARSLPIGFRARNASSAR
jgi:hypothetical protein